MSSISESKVEISVSDGTKMSAYVSRPASGHGGVRKPAMIVLQEAFGVNEHMREVTDRFAKLGYVSVAPELYHRTAPKGWTAPYTDFSQVTPHFQAMDEKSIGADMVATFEWLKTQEDVDGSRVCAVGYCMGGRCSYIANAYVPLRAAISYYGGRIFPDLLPLAAKQHGPILFFWGGLDKHIPPEHVQAVTGALRAAGKTFTNVEFSYADHAFFCDDRPAYNEKAARESWALSNEFLKNNL